MTHTQVWVENMADNWQDVMDFGAFEKDMEEMEEKDFNAWVEQMEAEGE